MFKFKRIKGILTRMVSAADFCLNRLTRISTAVKKRRRKRKRKAKMEKRMTSLVQSLKAVRKRKASRRRTRALICEVRGGGGGEGVGRR